MNFLNYATTYKTAVVESLQKLLSFDGTLKENPDSIDAPFGEGIRDSLRYVLELGRAWGFKTKNIDNIAGHIEYGDGDEIIGILCHVDVVPADGKWTYPPFSGTVVDGKIFGRGAVDDKGPTICSLYALKILKDLGIVPKKKIRLIIGTDEESHWRGITRYFQTNEMPDFGFSPDASFPIIYGEKGIMHIELINEAPSDIIVQSGSRFNVVPEQALARHCKHLYPKYTKYIKSHNYNGEIKQDTLYLYGKSAHAMEPEKGMNAAYRMAAFLAEYTEDGLIAFVRDVLRDSRLKEAGFHFSDHEMGDLTCNLGILNTGKDGGKACLDFRYPRNWDKVKFLEDFRNLAETYGLHVHISQDKQPHYVDKNDPDILTLHAAYIKYTKDTITPLFTIGGGTYARALEKGVAFGLSFPGREDVVHQTDEYVLTEDLVMALAIYTEAIYQLGLPDAVKKN